MPLLHGLVAGMLADRAAGDPTEALEWMAGSGPGRLPDGLEPAVTGLDEALGDRISDRPGADDGDDLRGVAESWAAVRSEVDPLDGVLGDEAAAVDWLVDEITATAAVDLSSDAERELGGLLATACAEAFVDLRERIEDDEQLHGRFETHLGVDVAEELDGIAEAFERLAGRPYGLYDLPEERQAVLDALLPADPVPFVDRDEVPRSPDPGRRFVLGPPGSGKSRIVAELVARLPEEAVSHVVVADDWLFGPTDAAELGRESLDGDLLLVWDDVHRVEAERKSVRLERTLTELEDALADEDRLHALLAARTGRLDHPPGGISLDEEEPWSEFQPLSVGELPGSGLRELVDRMADRRGVELPDSVRDALERTAGSRSAPVYVETVLDTVEDGARLTAEYVEGLPDDTADIWRDRYEDLRETAPEEYRVLAATKLLSDLDVPQFRTLVRAVYLGVLDGDRAEFHAAVAALRDRRWLTSVDDDGVVLTTRYHLHDTQLDPVDVSAADHASELSELLLGRVDGAVPDRARAPVHFYCGASLSGLGRHRQAGAHYRRAVDLAPEDAEAHYNHAAILHTELERPEEAETHYQQALTLAPEDAGAHYNYALLLRNELGRPEEAETHYRRVVELDPEDGEAHYNYANLLADELGRPEEAETHYRRAVDLDPMDAEAHYNYAVLLLEDLDRPGDAAELLETSVQLWVERRDIGNAIHDARALVTARRALEDWNLVAEHCDLGLELLNMLDESRPEQGLWFSSMRALADPGDTETQRVYLFALQNVLLGNPELSAELLEVGWERRGDHEPDAGQSAAMAAGVALAAHLRLFGRLDVSGSADGILEVVEPDELGRPARALYEQLSGRDPDETPGSLRSLADEHDDEAVEPRAFAVLLEELA